MHWLMVSRENLGSLNIPSSHLHRLQIFQFLWQKQKILKCCCIVILKEFADKWFRNYINFVILIIWFDYEQNWIYFVYLDGNHNIIRTCLLQFLLQFILISTFALSLASVTSCCKTTQTKSYLFLTSLCWLSVLDVNVDLFWDSSAWLLRCWTKVLGWWFKFCSNACGAMFKTPTNWLLIVCKSGNLVYFSSSFLFRRLSSTMPPIKRKITYKFTAQF